MTAAALAALMVIVYQANAANMRPDEPGKLQDSARVLAGHRHKKTAPSLDATGLVRLAVNASECRRVAEPRFNKDCAELPVVGSPEREAAYNRCAASTTAFLTKHKALFFAIGHTLLGTLPPEQQASANAGEITAQPCEIAVLRKDFDRIGRLVQQHALHRKVFEDEPWDRRTHTFPKFKGEYWIPLDDLAKDSRGAGVGLLYEPDNCAR